MPPISVAQYLSLHDALPISRSPQMPEVPTFKEQGYDIEGLGWYATFAPAGTPKEIVDRLSKAMTDAIRSPRSEEHTSELQSPRNLVCLLLLEKKKEKIKAAK